MHLLRKTIPEARSLTAKTTLVLESSSALYDMFIRALVWWHFHTLDRMVSQLNVMTSVACTNWIEMFCAYAINNGAVDHRMIIVRHSSIRVWMKYDNVHRVFGCVKTMDGILLDNEGIAGD